MDTINPKEIVKFVRYIAAGIDASKKPSRGMVASDIRCAIAAVNGDESAINHVRSIISNNIVDDEAIFEYIIEDFEVIKGIKREEPSEKTSLLD